MEMRPAHECYSICSWIYNRVNACGCRSLTQLVANVLILHIYGSQKYS